MKTPSFCSLSLLTIVLFLGPTFLRADMISHDECGVEFWIPEDWQHELEGDLLVVQNPAETVELFFLTSGIQVLGKVSDALLEEISRVIMQPEVTSVTEQGENNDLLYYEASGFGLYQTEVVDWELRFVAGARKSLMIIGLGELENHRQTIERIFETIQLIKLDPES